VSRQHDVQFGDQDRNLHQVASPENITNEYGDYAAGPSDKSSSTEVPPSNNNINTSSYQANERVEEKHRKGGMRSKLPGFLGGKKNKEEHYDDDKNNGKDKEKRTFWSQFRAVIFGSWINVLLIFCWYP